MAECLQLIFSQTLVYSLQCTAFQIPFPFMIKEKGEKAAEGEISQHHRGDIIQFRTMKHFNLDYFNPDKRDKYETC